MLDKSFRASAAALALALTVAGCGRSLPPVAGAFPDSQSQTMRSASKHSPLRVTPSKLAFTTTKNLTLTIEEAGYSGAFTIKNSKPKVAKAESSAKGPRASVKVTALSAGSGTLTVRDSHGQSKRIPFGVTTGVVVIQ